MLLALRSYFPGYSGAALRFKRYAAGLRAQGISMSVFAATTPAHKLRADEDTSDWIDVPVGRSVPPREVDGVSVHRVRLHDRRLRTPMYGAALARFCLRTRPDVVQVGSAELAFSPWLSVVRAAGIPVVVGYTLLNEPSPRPLWRRVQPLVWRAPFELATAVVVNSSAMADSLREIGVRTPIHAIPNGIDTDRFRPAAEGEKAALRRTLGLPVEGRIVVSCGAIVPRKGHALMLDAWRALAASRPDAHLVLVGPARNDGYLAGLRERDDPRVHFTGLVWNVEEYLRAADAFWFASRVEGLPNAVIEAMATGLPVVSGRFLGVSPELGRGGEEWVLVERDRDALGAAMGDLLDDEGQRSRIGAAARTWAVERLGLGTAVQGYADMYRGLV